MDQKQLKRNLHYFTKTDTPLYVGIGMLIVGVALFFFGRGYISYVIASILAPVGLVLALIGASHRVTDADMDACITKLTDGMEVDLVENPKFAKRMFKQIPMIKLQNYIFDDALAHKYAKNGAIRTEKLETSLIYALDTELYVVHRNFSLLADESDTQVHEIPYADIESIEITEQQTKMTFGKNPRTVTYSLLTIKGASTFELPMQSNADTDEFVSRVKRVLAESKQ
ncbi:MAG: hypothetical protein IIW17_03165 [Clostridia bacterium]|nr:hypothetical protein [Clostridia bacterium]